MYFLSAVNNQVRNYRTPESSQGNAGQDKSGHRQGLTHPRQAVDNGYATYCPGECQDWNNAESCSLPFEWQQEPDDCSKRCSLSNAYPQSASVNLAEGEYRTDSPVTSYHFTSLIYDHSDIMRNADAMRVDSIYLDLSKSPPSGATRSMAAGIVANADAQTPFEKVVSILRYLEHNYKFNSSVAEPPDTWNPTEYFLHRSKAGISPHFASAFCVMSRLNKIPCRVVSGFAPGITEDNVRYVQEGHKHVWAEIALDEVGWIGVETTPSNAEIGFGIGLGASGMDLNVIQAPTLIEGNCTDPSLHGGSDATMGMEAIIWRT